MWIKSNQIGFFINHISHFTYYFSGLWQTVLMWHPCALRRSNRVKKNLINPKREKKKPQKNKTQEDPFFWDRQTRKRCHLYRRQQHDNMYSLHSKQEDTQRAQTSTKAARFPTTWAPSNKCYHFKVKCLFSSKLIGRLSIKLWCHSLFLVIHKYHF